MIKQDIERVIREALEAAGAAEATFTVEHPDLGMGDYSTNAAIRFPGKKQEIFSYIEAHKPEEVESVELAGPGFINFRLTKDFFKQSLGEIIGKGSEFGKGEHAKGFKVMVEHTDPNPFKEFHIGHLMPNVIGSTIARIFEWNGAEVKQANYQGDMGIHVAKAVWGIIQGEEDPYVAGNNAYETHKADIDAINKKIYDGSDPEINKIYEEGRKKSLEYFETVYKRLGTKFDFSFFESETAPIGKKIVEDNIGTVFEKSDGAIVFKGEKVDPSLHTRVFINSQGIPTYEAKDLGNAKNKFDHYPYDLSVVVTGNEIKDYFRVVLAAMAQIFPDLAKKTKHLPHGMLRLPTGKMSSRTGNVITAEALIEEVKGHTKGDEQVAIGAVKYMILRQGIGQDIVFDFEKSVSTEGDSGVYLQYAHARANSILEKAGKKGSVEGEQGQVRAVERLLYRFPEVVERAGKEYAPNYIATYLTELAASFNNFYAHEQVLDDSPESGYRLAIVEAFKDVMKNGLNVLGIPAPERM
ncbi:arginine--tRNA ligase [Candidatus Parcubacteria bacterium]|nr:arginine--tRNA ligase [Candidatus Parcubacteria bacterium]